MALPYMPALIDDMFRAGLSNDLIQCLHAIAGCIPEQQSVIEDRLLQGVSVCLAGMKSAQDACDSTAPSLSMQMTRVGRPMTLGEDELEASGTSKRDGQSRNVGDSSRVRLNMSGDPTVVSDLVLSLHTLGFFSDSLGRRTTSEGVVPLLRFVEKVAAQYLSHPSMSTLPVIFTCFVCIPFAKRIQRHHTFS